MPIKGNDSRLFRLQDKESAKMDKYWVACWQKNKDVLVSGDPSASADLMRNSASSAAQLADATISVLYGALAMGPDVQRRCAECLMQHSRDRYQTGVEQLRKLVLLHYNQLHTPVRPLLLKLAAELCEREATGVDGLLLALLRQVAIGDLSEANVWLASTLLHTLRKSYAWVTGPQGPPALLQSVLYKYLRLLPDITRSAKNTEQVLAKHSASLCVSILKEHWGVCAGIGRDLARALQFVCSLSDFKPIWQALLAGRAPSGEPHEGQDDALSALLCTRTPQHLLASAVTQDMEKELFFMMTKVRMGNQLRYQHWFQSRFLSAPESESVLPDIVRYICGVYHPPNQIIASDVVPRWALIGWLMQVARAQTSLANMKLSLVLDLLLFQPSSDSIMNIEPAMLLMVHSIPKYPAMTNSLLEFLILAKDHYNPARRPLTNRGFVKGMTALVQRRVVPSLDALIRAEEVAPDLRDYLYNTFKQFCSVPPDHHRRNSRDGAGAPAAAAAEHHQATQQQPQRSPPPPDSSNKRPRDPPHPSSSDQQHQQQPPAKRHSTGALGGLPKLRRTTPDSTGEQPQSPSQFSPRPEQQQQQQPSGSTLIRGPGGEAASRSQFHSGGGGGSAPVSPAASPRAGPVPDPAGPFTGPGAAAPDLNSNGGVPPSPSAATAAAAAAVPSSSVQQLAGVTAAALRLQEEVSDLLKGKRDSDELNITGAVRDLLAAVESDHGSEGERGPLGADSAALAAAAEAVVECAAELHGGGVAVFDNLPGDLEADSSSGAQRSLRSPLAATPDCLGGALFDACCASLAAKRRRQQQRQDQQEEEEEQQQQDEENASSSCFAAPLLLAALRQSPEAAVADLGPCLLSHVLAGAPQPPSDGAAEKDEEDDGDDGASDSFSPSGDGSAERCALYREYSEAAAALVAPNDKPEDTNGGASRRGLKAATAVLAEDLRGCLRWGLSDARSVLFAMLASEGAHEGGATVPSSGTGCLEPIVAGNAEVAEVAAAVLMPSDILRLSARLSSGRAFLCLGLPAILEPGAARSDGQISSEPPLLSAAVGRGLRVVRSSVAWDAHSQATLWSLLGSEASTHGHAAAEELAAECLREVSARAARAGSSSPSPGPAKDNEDDDDDDRRRPESEGTRGRTDAMAVGLAAFLRLFPPSDRLVSALRGLPPSCRDLAAAVLSAWQLGSRGADDPPKADPAAAVAAEDGGTAAAASSKAKLLQQKDKGKLLP